jgi:sulfatase maturation enzyme AslB (radical SAM superfamily)
MLWLKMLLGHKRGGEIVVTLNRVKRLPRRAIQKIDSGIKFKWNRWRLNGYKRIPSILYLEVTNKCNANCIFCKRSDVHKPLMHMDFDMFKAIVDAAPYTTQVHTQGFGEPLMYPHLIDAIKYCKERNKRVVFYTNASLLDDDMAIKLLETGVDQIRFSVDEITPELYEPLRRGLKWDVVLANIENFHKRKKDGNYKTETVARICKTKENEARMYEITKFWSKRADLVVVMPEVNIPTYDENAACLYETIDPGMINCPNPYEQFAVRSNGDVVLCCSDWFHNYVIDNISIGPITQERILDIFNSKEYEILRNRMESGILCPTRCLSCKGIVPPKRRLI